MTLTSLGAKHSSSRHESNTSIKKNTQREAGNFFSSTTSRLGQNPLGKKRLKKKRTALLSAIATSPLHCYAMALRVPDYSRVRNGSEKAKRYLHEDPWCYLLQELAFDTARKIVEFDPKANISFVAGPHEKNAQYEEFYQGFKRKNPVIAEHMLGMTHGNFKKMYSLQAADLIASESKKCWESAQCGELSEKIFHRHPILCRFVGFNTITEERLKGVVEVQGRKNQGRAYTV